MFVDIDKRLPRPHCLYSHACRVPNAHAQEDSGTIRTRRWSFEQGPPGPGTTGKRAEVSGLLTKWFLCFPSICYFDSDMIFINKHTNIMMAYGLEQLLDA